MRLIPEGHLYDLLKSLDKKIARFFGFSGDHTLSAECSQSKTVACKCLCAVMDLLEADHCKKAAESEVE
jgi:hypothetical protein